MDGGRPMKGILGGTCIALAVVGLLAACMPRGKPLTPEEAQAVEANLAEMEVRVAEQVQASMEQEGASPATAEEVHAMLSGNTAHTVGSGFKFSTFYQPDGTLRVRLVTAEGVFRSAGTWSVTDDGMRCVTIEGLKGNFRNRGWSFGPYRGKWETSHEMNCYRVYYEDDTETWILVSGPHFLKSGTAVIMPGMPSDL